MEVAASLARRDQFAPEKSLALWHSHLVEAERDSRGLPRATICYDALLADAGAALNRVCEDAAFPLKASAAQKKAAIEFVQPDLQRQHHGAPKRPARESLASGLDTVLDGGYAKLAELPAGKDPQQAIGALVTAARAALAAAIPPWLAQELETAQAYARERAAETDLARGSITELEGHINAARAAHGVRDEMEAALRARADELALTRQDLAAVRESLRAEIASMGASGIGTVERELRDTIARQQQELGDERATIARLTEQIDQARFAAQNQEQQIAMAREHMQELLGQLDAARQAHETKDAQEAAMQENLDATHEELSVLGAEFNALRLERDEMATKLAQLVPEADALRHDLAIRDRERDALAATAKQTGEAVASLSAELARRAVVEQELSADRARLAQFEREARERIALLEGQLAALSADARTARERFDVANAELQRLDRRWLGRLARRLALST
jgi:chromosome segregation ATPase